MAVLEVVEPSNKRLAVLKTFLRSSPLPTFGARPRSPCPCGNCPLLAPDPHFVLLDEPFAGIDLIAGDIRDLVKYLKDRGIRGVLITDHNVRDTLTSSTGPTSLTTARLMEGPKPAISSHNNEDGRVYLGNRLQFKITQSAIGVASSSMVSVPRLDLRQRQTRDDAVN